MTGGAPFRKVSLGPAQVVVGRDAQGGYRLRSPAPLNPYPARLTERLLRWAKESPERTFVAKRGADGEWRRISYAEALQAARRIGQGLLERGLSAERPLMILSENDLEHAMLALAALHAGVPFVPVSPAYSLVSQDYARANRAEMMDLVLEALRRHLPAFEVTSEAVNCHHNYVERETHYGESVWLTRKGAIRARKGELGIIPGSMGTRSYIVRGKGSAQAFDSCAHGAGRRMSRTQAEKQFSLADLAVQTEGVICRKDRGVLDEIPGAYKDIDAVMANQSDLVEVVHTLKQVLCVKG
jgi:hypothetical protein